ncbi:hypothetical protein D3C77_527690 [compost metagenome]
MRINSRRDQIFILTIKIIRSVIYGLIVIHKDLFRLITLSVLVIGHGIERFGQSSVDIILVLCCLIVCIRLGSHQSKQHIICPLNRRLYLLA